MWIGGPTIDTAESNGNFCRQSCGEADSGRRRFVRKLFNDEPIVGIEWLTLLLRILEVPDSNLCPKTGCAVIFMGFFSCCRQMLGYLKAVCGYINIITNLLFVSCRIIQGFVIRAVIIVVK